MLPHSTSCSRSVYPGDLFCAVWQKQSHLFIVHSVDQAIEIDIFDEDMGKVSPAAARRTRAAQIALFHARIQGAHSHAHAHARTHLPV